MMNLNKMGFRHRILWSKIRCRLQVVCHHFQVLILIQELMFLYLMMVGSRQFLKKTRLQWDELPKKKLLNQLYRFQENQQKRELIQAPLFKKLKWVKLDSKQDLKKVIQILSEETQSKAKVEQVTNWSKRLIGNWVLDIIQISLASERIVPVKVQTNL